MAIAFVGGLLVFAKSKLRTLFKYAGPPLLFFVWIYASSNFVVGYRAVMIKIGLFGICMGILFSFLKLRKHDSSIGVL
jgi:vacuolar-type H+-ATPase subunit I/STV1